MERIFDSSGALLAEPSSDCIFAIRQICLFAKKLKLSCTKQRERAAEASYVDVERSLRTHVVPSDLAKAFSCVSAIVWSDILQQPGDTGFYEEVAPRHGPGATVEGVRGNGKYHFPSWPQRLEREFPLTEFGIGSIRNYDGGALLSRIAQPIPRDETPVKVVFVPKTQRSPRVIGMEPVCMQYIQQSISNWLRPRIELRGRFTAGRVNFSSQTVNAKLALDSSRSRTFATIDMSDASDRVSADLVNRMLRVAPSFRRGVFACRSTRATLPSGVVIPLRKFASMGSALCFPMEAMAFFLAIVTHRIRREGVPITSRAVLKCCNGVYVYGDDLIVPTDEAPAICETLAQFGFKVNSHKSFWNGKFRESCGMDAYDGTDVTPTYVRRLLPANRSDSHGIASTVALANQFYLKGMWETARALRSFVEKLLGPLGSISDESHRLLERVIDGRVANGRGSAGLGWVSFSNAETFHGWDNDYQCLKDRRWIVTPVRRKDVISGDPALLKCFGVIGSESVSPHHLRESVRYGNLALKRRWITL